MKFKDIKFEKGQFNNGIQARIKLKDEMILSIVAGEFAYCIPRKNSEDPNEFKSFEIAIMNKEGDFVTRDFFKYAGDDVQGWVSREEIEKIIKKLS